MEADMKSAEDMEKEIVKKKRYAINPNAFIGNEWRSETAQIFVVDRILKIDGYWQANNAVLSLFDVINAFCLWDLACRRGGLLNKNLVKQNYKELKALVDQSGAANARLRNQKEFAQLLNDAEQLIVAPLQKLFEKSDLTINFKAKSWFEAQEGFDDYKTMWDIRPDNKRLNQNIDPNNPPGVRAKADRWALYGQFDDGKQDVLNAGMALPHVKGGNAKPFEYSATKKHSGQDTAIFAGLNYGSRNHGAASLYGKSYFILKKEMYKKNAIYFAMDTFTPVFDPLTQGAKAKAQRQKLFQVSAGSFGGAILLAIGQQCIGKSNEVQGRALARDLLESALGRNFPKADVASTDIHLLIEAHLFQPVVMDHLHIERVCISQSEADPSLSANIRTFCTKHSLKFSLI
jgi:hypothetical protein